jgi:hypothetical protein
MAVVRDRSMNAELLEGMCDGSYKRHAMNYSNYPDPDRRANWADRNNLMRGWGGYGIFEAGVDRRPDWPDGGSEKRTPDLRFCI